MRISQPTDCEVTTHLLRRLSGQFELSLALWHVFSLDDQAEPIKDSRVLWKLAKQHWQNRALDEGFPKSQSEFFCFGSAYPPAELDRGPFAASVSVGQVKRDLAIYGQRLFGALGDVQEATPPRQPIALTPQNAFGGAAHETNPEGVGYLAKFGETAPSIEDPSNPITSSSAHIDAAGFWPQPVTSEVRSRHLGKFDRRWLERDWPNFPPDTNMAFFQMAPVSQQLPAFLVGNEAVEIVGMHPVHSKLSCKLPGRQAQCVFKRTRGADNIFEGWAHTTMKPETVYLFPNEGVGVLLHRGVIKVERADGLDLSELLFQLEPAGLHTPPSDIMIQLYRTRWLQPTEPPAATPELIPVNPAKSSDGSESVGAGLVSKKVTRAGTVKLWPEFEHVLSQPGISAELAQAIRSADDPLEALSSELKRQLADGRAAYEAALKNSGLTEQSYLKAMSEIPQVREALGADVASINLGAELGRLTYFIDMLVDNLRQSQPVEPVMAQTSSESVSDSTDTDVDAETLAQIRDFVQNQMGQPTQFRGMNLSGLHLVGLDLAGMDFSDAICEGTQFRDCNLVGTRFQQAILTRANFMRAKMALSDLSGAVCQHAIFDEAVLTEANLKSADLTDCSCRLTRFDGSILTKAKFNQSDLTEATFARVNAAETAFNESLLSQCDFTGAELASVDFIKARLSSCVFNQVTSNRLEFSGASIKECEFTDSNLSSSVAMLKASVDGCRFKNTDLSGSNWTAANVINTIFSECTLVKFDLSSGNLQKTRFSRCQASSLSFFSCVMEAVDLLQNNLMQASFHGADIRMSSMIGNNMYGADFAETKIDNHTQFEANVTLKTSLVWREQPGT